MAAITLPAKSDIKISRYLPLAGLGAILLLSAILNFWGIDQESTNPYYAAAVKSMLQSWHNFFFVAYDPGGFVTVDKPPLGLWVQCASVALFGFSSFSLILPQALAGVLSVAVLYKILARTFGKVAGLLAALVLAVTPVSVAANRNNTMDSQLVLVLLLAAWAALVAAEKADLRLWLLAFALVGVGFNLKMLQAYLVLPAILLVLLLASQPGWQKKALWLVAGTALLLLISLAWVLAVDFTPADQRPYVGSSQDNSALALAVGYNGLVRLLPGLQLPEATTNRPPVLSNLNAPGRANLNLSLEIEGAGPLRLFNKALSGQVSWFLPLALLGLVVVFFREKVRLPLSGQQNQLLLWSGWLLPQIIFFSFANFFHRYYLEMLSPAVAALGAISLVAYWQDYRAGRWQGWLLPLTPVIAAVIANQTLAYFPDWNGWLRPAVAGICIAAAFGLATIKWVGFKVKLLWLLGLTGAGVIGMLIAPFVWSLTPLMYGGESHLPYAGPDLARKLEPDPPTSDPALVQFLTANRGNAQYLAATSDSNLASPLILATGQPVMALGGFAGSDRILSPEQLDKIIKTGQVRFFLLPPSPPGGDDLASLIARSCRAMPDRAGPGSQSPLQLFDCRQ